MWRVEPGHVHAALTRAHILLSLPHYIHSLLLGSLARISASSGGLTLFKYCWQAGESRIHIKGYQSHFRLIALRVQGS